MPPKNHTQPDAFLPAMGHDHLISLYDPFSKLLGVEAFHRALLAQAALRPGQRVLEIGCGTGNLVLLAKRLHADTYIVGIDPDPKALARALRKARRAALDVRLDRGYAQALPYADASFERVLSAFMFHHLPAAVQVAALREVRRVLTPGGTLHLLDIHGAHRPTGGFFARRQPHEDHVPKLMAAAGLRTQPAIAQGNVRLGGMVTTYAATAPGTVRDPGHQEDAHAVD